MKKISLFAALLLAAGAGCQPDANAQYLPPEPAPAAAEVGASYYPMGPDQVDQLTSRIALYPDALLSDVLVACTYPLEVVQANQYLAGGNNPAGVDAQNWDPSVKSVAHYPDVLSRMASDVNWMNQLGAVFLNQQQQVMDSVQRLRGRALAEGRLFSTPQQHIIQDGPVIEIVPSEPDVIYVPTYDSQQLLADNYYSPATSYEPFLTFDAGYPVGTWLHWDCDWDDHRIYYGDWGRDRPWWNWHDHDRYRYDNFRPGHFEDRGHDIHVWGHDDHREMPRYVPAAAPHERFGDRGFEARDADRRVDDGRVEINRGFEATRDAARGRDSRQDPGFRQQSDYRAAPRGNEAPRANESPRRDDAPRANESPRRDETPRRSEPPRPNQAPAREERPVEPSRGGGEVHGYGRGEDVGHASARGGESRGGGGGGVHESGGPTAGGTHGGGGGHR